MVTVGFKVLNEGMIQSLIDAVMRPVVVSYAVIVRV